MKNPEKKFTHRRTYFVMKSFQARFILVSALLIIAGLAAAAWYTAYEVRDALENALYRSHITQESTGQFILPILLRVNILAAAAFLALALIIFTALKRRYNSYFERLTRKMNFLPDQEDTVLPAVNSPFSDIEKNLEQFKKDVEQNQRECRSMMKQGQDLLQDIRSLRSRNDKREVLILKEKLDAYRSNMTKISTRYSI